MTEEKDKALIWVESLRGSGHMRVISTLQKKLQQQGMEVHIATSSREFAQNFDFNGVHWHEMPPLTAANVEFRTSYLKNLGHALHPTCIITENWPLGRSDYDPELTGLMQEVHGQTPRPKIFSLSREILFGGIARTEQGMQKAAQLVDDYYDHVIVLGPRDFPGLDLSFPAVEKFKDKIFYAGYMSESLPPRNHQLDDIAREVVVSTGGGVTEHGFKMLECAIRAHGLTKNAYRPLHLFVPPAYRTTYTDQGVNWYEHLNQLAKQLNAQATPKDGRIIIEDTSSEYLAHLANASMSISQGGSNTTVEVASATDVDALIAPIKQRHNDIGQEIRTQMFASLGLVHAVDHKLIDPSSHEAVRLFARHVDRTIGSKKAAQFAHVDCRARHSNLSFFGDEHAAAFIHSVIHRKPLGQRHRLANQHSPMTYSIEIHEEPLADSPSNLVQVATIQAVPKRTPERIFV